jgi:hypothetical protein
VTPSLSAAPPADPGVLREALTLLREIRDALAGRPARHAEPAAAGDLFTPAVALAAAPEIASQDAMADAWYKLGAELRRRLEARFKDAFAEFGPHPRGFIGRLSRVADSLCEAQALGDRGLWRRHPSEADRAGLKAATESLDPWAYDFYGVPNLGNGTLDHLRAMRLLRGPRRRGVLERGPVAGRAGPAVRAALRLGRGPLAVPAAAGPGMGGVVA